ncbi:L-2-amino-thiazoline-4-carboxylic acid hydrolase [Clostridiaceae bacterium M8S5]|nr:L-2-amino-thiazoline-4-carboxylic acid hydrolase [Clostridiaceae bacterium M8S5]
MKANSLYNYGKSLDKVIEDMPNDAREYVQKVFKSEMKKNLGFIKMIRFILAKRTYDKKIANIEHDVARKLNVQSEKFVKNLLNRASAFGALSKIIGKDEALKFNCNLAEKTTYDLMSRFHPTLEELKSCGDPFEVYKQYMITGLEANVKVGIHEFEVIEDTDDVLRFDVTSCAFHSIPDYIGLGETCIVSCYSDDVFYPRYCEQLGLEFIRTGTIARGDKVCDFCFRRKK